MYAKDKVYQDGGDLGLFHEIYVELGNVPTNTNCTPCIAGILNQVSMHMVRYEESLTPKE